MDILSLAFLGVLPALVISAALTDLTSMRIPNWISAGLAVAFYPAALIAGLPLESFLVHTGVGVAALFVGMAMFAMRWVGGGDAKLLAATCLWMGLEGMGPFLLYTAMAGGAFGLLLLAARSYLRPFVSGAPKWVMTLLEPKGDIPYGVAIAIGALLAFPGSPLVLAALA